MAQKAPGGKSDWRLSFFDPTDPHKITVLNETEVLPELRTEGEAKNYRFKYQLPYTGKDWTQREGGQREGRTVDFYVSVGAWENKSLVDPSKIPEHGNTYAPDDEKEHVEYFVGIAENIMAWLQENDKKDGKPNRTKVSVGNYHITHVLIKSTWVTSPCEPIFSVKHHREHKLPWSPRTPKAHVMFITVEANKGGAIGEGGFQRIDYEVPCISARDGHVRESKDFLHAKHKQHKIPYVQYFNGSERKHGNQAGATDDQGDRPPTPPRKDFNKHDLENASALRPLPVRKQEVRRRDNETPESESRGSGFGRLLRSPFRGTEGSSARKPSRSPLRDAYRRVIHPDPASRNESDTEHEPAQTAKPKPKRSMLGLRKAKDAPDDR